MNSVTDTSGQPTSVNSALPAFNATPTPFNFNNDPNGIGSATAVVKDGKVGNIDLPQAAAGSVVQIPTSVAWMPGQKTGALTFQYLDAAKNSGPLEGGPTAATVVVFTNQPYVNQPVSLQNANPQITYPTAYSAQGGDIHEVPRPEPATMLAWAGMIGRRGHGPADPPRPPRRLIQSTSAGQSTPTWNAPATARAIARGVGPFEGDRVSSMLHPSEESR
ncbi:MAG: hypothetical protein U0790_25020 [Isosphaeraceae bacterium]